MIKNYYLSENQKDEILVFKPEPKEKLTARKKSRILREINNKRITSVKYEQINS